MEFYRADLLNQPAGLSNLNLIEVTMNYRDFCGSQEFNLNASATAGAATAVGKKHPTTTHHSMNKSKSSNLRLLNENGAGGFYLSADLSSTTSSSSNSSLQMSNSATGETASSPTPQHTAPTEMYNFYNSSLISDYRLTLTDLIDLNLIDISNGMIINPLNGARLTIADAIRIDLLNSDVKEVANTFLLPGSFQSTTAVASLKLTVKEAIQNCVLNPNRNEIYLNKSNKLNLFEAKKKNLILKPLTLSEAFIRNLIQPNGFVRNPINNKYYAFESLIINDLSTRQAPTDGEYLHEQPIYLFDLDTKHIIDPNDAEKRLLSLSEAIDMELIIPRTFELNIRGNNQHPIRRVNLYEAFFNSSQLNLSLLLYKPEIENVYVRLTTSVLNQNNNNNAALKQSPSVLNQQRKISVLLSKRDKLGLLEAINLNVLNLKLRTYCSMSDACDRVSLDDAVSKFKLVDGELIDLLNTPTGIQRSNRELTVYDCINDSTLVLEKYLFKNPFNNELVNLDSHTCKVILGDETVRRIKKLITRINIKSYIISLNSSDSKCTQQQQQMSQLKFAHTSTILNNGAEDQIVKTHTPNWVKHTFNS